MIGWMRRILLLCRWCNQSTSINHTPVKVQDRKEEWKEPISRNSKWRTGEILKVTQRQRSAVCLSNLSKWTKVPLYTDWRQIYQSNCLSRREHVNMSAALLRCPVHLVIQHLQHFVLLQWRLFWLQQWPFIKKLRRARYNVYSSASSISEHKRGVKVDTGNSNVTSHWEWLSDFRESQEFHG